MLDGPDVGVEGVYREERMTPLEASEREIQFSRDVVRGQVDAVGRAREEPAGRPDPLLYARVDLVTDDQGAPVLMELELVEPSLFTALGEGALERFADAIAQRAEA